MERDGEPGRVSTLALAIVGAALAASIARYVALRVLGPIVHDEVAFLHIGWMVGRGARPIADFFDHHNQPYEYFLGWLAAGDGSLRFALSARLASLALSLVTGALVAALVARSDLEIPARARALAALFAAATLFFFQDTHAFDIRPESIALPPCIAAWLLAREVRDRGARARGGLALAVGLLLGLALASSVRSSFVSLVIFIALGLELARARGFGACALLGGGCLASVATFLLLPPRLFYDWVIRFSGSLGPRVPITEYVLTPSPQNLLRWAVAIAAGACLFARRKNALAARLAPDSAPVLIALAGPLLEKTPYDTAMIFVALAASVWLGLAALRARPVALVLSIAFVVAAAADAPLIVERFRSIPALARPPAGRPERDTDLATSIALRTALRDALGGGRVLASPETHPIVIEDASYWWYGNDFIVHGTLDRARIDHRPYRVLDDVIATRPALISRSTEILPPLIELARRERREDELDRFFRENYVLTNIALVRSDVAARLGVR